MVIAVLLFVILILVLALLLILQGDRKLSGFAFYSRGRELGFTFNETRIIRETATIVGIEDSLSVFLSTRDLDLCIKAITKRFKLEGSDKNRNNMALMEKLFELRKKLEFDLPKNRSGIFSSRSIRANQKIKILIPSIGAFPSTVIENNERYLVVTTPTGFRLPPGFIWRGAHVSIYFWRQEDAGYVFDSYVLEEVRIRNIPVLQLGHSESLFRTQKRKSVRMRSRMPSYLYILKHLEGAYEKPEKVPGMKCVVQDLSEDGAAVLIGGKATSGMFVKLQFWIDDDQIVLSGTVKGSEYNSEKNQSILHIEALTPSTKMRNTIRSHVYNLKTDEDGAAEAGRLDGNAFSG